MKRTMGRVFLLLLAFVLLVSGCTLTTNAPGELHTDHVSLYFANSDATDLVEERISVGGVPVPQQPRYVMEKLLDGPTNPALARAIRPGTSLLNLWVDKGAVTVDLSKEFYNEENIADVLAAASIIKSLCSVSSVTSVSIWVEAMPLQLDDGTIITDLKDGDLVFDADALTQDEENISLYFSDGDSLLAREIRRVTVPKGETMEKLILSELIRGPQNSMNYRTVPAETKIRSVETKDGVCFVNLSADFIHKHSGGSTAEIMTIYSIVNSLTELSTVSSVQFLIEGEKKDVYIHMVFNEPIARDISMVQGIKH
ncbi:MAG: GerMN domain-containing protein [Clostridia bacterium]|nr:GerMN domain-containing protein [Clostridia bacterium]